MIKNLFSMASVIKVYTNSCLEITITSVSRIFFSFFFPLWTTNSKLFIDLWCNKLHVGNYCVWHFISEERSSFLKSIFCNNSSLKFFFTGIFEGFDNLGTKFTRWRLIEGWYYFERTSMSLVAFVKLSVFVLGSDYELPSLMATGNSSWSN